MSTVAQTVLRGQSATRPKTNPIREGFVFVDWYSEQTGGSPYDFDSPITQNTTVWARWTEIPTPQIPEFTVIFNLNGGEGNLSTVAQTVLQGQSATRPETNPIREDFAFVDWYSEQTGGSPYDFESPITQDTTLWARWTEITYAVIWNTDGGSLASTQTSVVHGGSITVPTLVRKNGYIFGGWFTDEALTQRATFPINNVTSDRTFWAKWNNIGVATDGAQRTIDVGGISIEVIFVEAGTFTQEDPRFGYSVFREVTLSRGFWIGKYPVTQVQYEAVMGNNPSHFGGRPNNPVELVTWHNATAFAEAVGGRLPTEAESGFAARGGNKSQGFRYSGSNDLNEVGWFRDNSSSTQAVGQKSPNELGIYDMSGNVAELVNDWWENFDEAPVTDPIGPSTASQRVIRGGGWSDPEDFSRVNSRDIGNPNVHRRSLGFRIVFDAN